MLTSLLPIAVANQIASMVGNVLVSIIVFVRLALDEKKILHVLQDELNRPWAPEDVVCVYTLRGRNFFVKDGRLNPKVTYNEPVFEKMKLSQKSAYGKSIGNAPTASGDDPITWRIGKMVMKSLIKPSAEGSSIVDVLSCVSPAITDFLHEACEKQRPVVLYKGALRATLAQVFSSMTDSELSDCFTSDIDLERLFDSVDRIGNAGVESKLKKHDGTYHLITGAFQAALANSPRGTLGHKLHNMRDECPCLPENTGFCNAFFYWIAISSVSSNIISHFVLTMMRHPEDLERCLHDRVYFRMCLKECIRLFPPVSKYLPRRSKIATQLGNATIPPHSFVIILPTLQIKDTCFRPERWRGNCDITKAHFDDVESIYAPFSDGARACLVRSYAKGYFEDLVWNVITQFEFKLIDEDFLRDAHPSKQHISDFGVTFRLAADYRFAVRRRS